MQCAVADIGGLAAYGCGASALPLAPTRRADAVGRRFRPVRVALVLLLTVPRGAAARACAAAPMRPTWKHGAANPSVLCYVLRREPPE